MTELIRINKYIADQGWASRREADQLIIDGKILVNGKKAVLGLKITEKDKVELKGNVKERVYLAYYKGRGIITHSPGEGETDIAMRLKKDYSLTNVSPVGRLDKDSEGLIILSNDGRVTGPLLNPEEAHEKEYEVHVDKKIKSSFLKEMAKGVDIEGYKTKKAKVAQPSKNPDSLSFHITLTEGKKHQIRRMCAALGYQIQGLKRVRIENIELGKLKPNQYRKIANDELKEFLKILNIK
ncbi:MAG: 23S rRNA pseudouridine2604 synthase [Candidatus Azotimanducaceae bacterium]|jgi:23S rRNA pseudouridine2604 synthase